MGRKHDYTQHLPAHYCGNCSHVAFPDDLVCPSCETAPDGEWPSISDGFDAWLGRVLDGRYVITQRVGQGAMGTVYRAESLAISRQFAVKIINFKEGASGLDPSQIRARLHREIEAIGRLRNPHVVLFYEVIELFDHFVGVVMDYIDGPTLEELVLSEGPLRPKRALTILRQVANGVHEVHELGMIHRDLKPENIMIERLPAGDDFAHVLDFGIVRIDDGVSMTKGFLGTPLYASPEQAMGGALDRRSDVYSLGCVLFFMLTSHAPFESQNVYEILQAHVRRPVPSLAETLGHSVVSALEDLVTSMLAKSPEKRPQSLAEVISAVDRMLRLGDLDDVVPDSLDLVMSGPVHQTGANKAVTEGLAGESSSVFESAERDRTGPKAAIFKRGSRSGVQQAIHDQRTAIRKDSFDRVYKGRTGATTLGIAVDGEVIAGSCATNGSLALQTTHGICLTREDELRNIGEFGDITVVGNSAVHALGGTRAGHIFELTDSGPVELFQDLRREAITAIALALDDEIWLVGSASGRLYKCAPSAGKKMWLRICDGPAIAGLAIDARCETFAVARAHGEVEISYLANPKQSFARFSVSGPVRDVTLSDDGRLVAVLFEDDSVSVHLVDTGHAIHRLRDEKNRIFAVGFVGEELLGYFVLDGKMYARHLDRAQSPVESE